MPKKSEAAAIVVLSLAFLGINLYRAATQSITIDEAYTYLSFVKPPLLQVLTTYAANNHVLHSLLCKASTDLFGLSELTLRLPSVSGGALYLFSLIQITRLLLKGAWARILVLLLLTLNPLVLDFSSVARGYSLGLGFLFLGLCGLLLFLRKSGNRGHLVLVGAAFGLSVSSVLTFIFPVIACLSVFSVLLPRNRTPGERLKQLSALWVPAAAVSFLINIGPLSKARRADFVIGFGSIYETLKNTLYPFLRHHHAAVTIMGRQIEPFDLLYPVSRCTVLVGFVLAALLLVVGFITKRQLLQQDASLLSGSLVAAVLLLIAAHRTLGIQYPEARTAIYFVPMVVLAVSGILRDLRGVPPLAMAWLPFGAIGLALSIQFVSQINVTYYNQWSFDAGTRAIAQFLLVQPSAGRRVKITATWTLIPCLNFYREMYQASAWEPVDGQNGETKLTGDYVVFDAASAQSIPLEPVRPIFADKLSGAVVAIRTFSVGTAKP